MNSEFAIEHCDFPWTSSMISLDKTMRCCCAMTLPVGNIGREKPEQIWNNLTMQSLRQSMSNGVLHSTCLGASCKFVQARNPQVNTSRMNYSEEGFDEKWYVENYPDVEEGVFRCKWASGKEHYFRYGHNEYRYKNELEAQMSIKKINETKLVTGVAELASSIEFLNKQESITDSTTLTFYFKAKNLGSTTWLPNSEILLNQPSVRCGATLFASINDVAEWNLSREYRSFLTEAIKPGQETDFQITIDSNHLEVGESVLVVDVVNELNFWFADRGSRPLVLLLSKEHETKDISWCTR